MFVVDRLENTVHSCGDDRRAYCVGFYDGSAERLGTGGDAYDVAGPIERRHVADDTQKADLLRDAEPRHLIVQARPVARQAVPRECYTQGWPGAEQWGYRIKEKPVSLHFSQHARNPNELTAGFEVKRCAGFPWILRTIEEGGWHRIGNDPHCSGVASAQQVRRDYVRGRHQDVGQAAEQLPRERPEKRGHPHFASDVTEEFPEMPYARQAFSSRGQGGSKAGDGVHIHQIWALLPEQADDLSRQGPLVPDVLQRTPQIGVTEPFAMGDVVDAMTVLPVPINRSAFHPEDRSRI
jgi:hypothetical protein